MSFPKVLLLDGDGVIWIDKYPIKGAIESLDKIRAMGVRLVLVTNNCSKTRAQYLKFMQGLGLHGFTEEDIFSSGYATAQYLIQHNISHVFISGFDGLGQELELHGIDVHTIKTDPEPQLVEAVIVSKSHLMTNDEISRAIYLVKNGAKLIGTNPDPNFPLSHGVLVPGSGAHARTFEVATNTKATLIGKPEDPMFECVLSGCGITADDLIMVGDRMITDIFFAAHHNARSILVLSGVDTEETVKEFPEFPPTYVLPSLVEAVDLLQKLKDESSK